MNTFFFTDGQKIAKKLSVSIMKETKGVKFLLEDYLLILDELRCDGPLPSLSEVLFLGSDFWKVNSLAEQTDATIPWKIKEEIAQAFLVTKRSNEELRMLEVEMTAVIQYWFNRVMVIVGRLNELTFDCEDLYIRGARSLLERLKLEAELHHQKAFTMFSKFIDVRSFIQLTTTKTYEELETAEESESDTESDVDSDSSETEF